MESTQIQHADVLDIIFEGRNKDYGAYDLRKTYNKRMVSALLLTGAICLLLYGHYLLALRVDPVHPGAIFIEDRELINPLAEEPKVEPPPLPPPPKEEPPKTEIAKFATYKISSDDDVREEEKPPTMDKLEDVTIGKINQPGIKGDEIVAPPASHSGKGLIALPKKEGLDDDEIFRSVEIESEYPGGPGAWMRYLNKTIQYPDQAVEREIQGTVVVQFIVDKEGNVSDVEAISGPKEGGLRDEAVRVIRKSGKWTPAVQNGRQVKSYQSQPITFRLASE